MRWSRTPCSSAHRGSSSVSSATSASVSNGTTRSGRALLHHNRRLQSGNSGSGRATSCHYRTLGLRRDASSADIKKAYQNLAKKWHPDVNQSPEATTRFSEINGAYKELNNAESKAQYDARTGHHPSSSHQWSWNHGTSNGRNSRADNSEHSGSSRHTWWEFDTFGRSGGGSASSSSSSSRNGGFNGGSQTNYQHHQHSNPYSRDSGPKSGEFGFDFDAFEDIYSRLYETYGESQYFTQKRPPKPGGYYSYDDDSSTMNSGIRNNRKRRRGKMNRRQTKEEWFELTEEDLEGLFGDNDDSDAYMDDSDDSDSDEYYDRDHFHYDRHSQSQRGQKNRKRGSQTPHSQTNSSSSSSSQSKNSRRRINPKKSGSPSSQSSSKSNSSSQSAKATGKADSSQKQKNVHPEYEYDSSEDSEEEYFRQFNEEAFWRFVRNGKPFQRRGDPSQGGRASRKRDRRGAGSGGGAGAGSASHRSQSADKKSGKPASESEGNRRMDSEDHRGGFDRNTTNKNRNKKNMKRDRHDIEQSIHLDFMDSVLGCKKAISFSRMEKCPKCDGSGNMGFTDPNSGYPQYSSSSGHSICMCDECAGSGELSMRKEVSVTLPCGLRSKDRVRVAKCGHFSKGDLWLRVSGVRDHELFVRVGDDIHVTMTLPYALSILGGSLSVPTIYGPSLVRCMGMSSHTYSKIKNKGVFDPISKQRGDQYVHFELGKVPDPLLLTDEQRNALAVLAKADGEPCVRKPSNRRISRDRHHFKKVGSKLGDQPLYDGMPSDMSEEETAECEDSSDTSEDENMDENWVQSEDEADEFAYAQPWEDSGSDGNKN